ncbi:hypothetical protein HUJ04_004237 [Dendroctonus ponderosae]|uniref:C2H2-type domain-containing protein n=1 Tax=Dendroctonus ponderosae TaxID=77166 RepID=A0AAR5QKB9_DENPD|nr:hypothetical protein HUJ04_004237 [Dendroctonus ponderosae]KAH1014430.1 hypothetical protein HUJ05_012295 [Dendroctonus ponderosae]
MYDIVQRQKEEVSYSCSQCTVIMPNKKHYIMHMLTTHTTFSEDTRLIHLCYLCNFQTDHKQQLKKHIEFYHMQKVKLNCPFCSFASCYALNLRRHISIHEDMQNLTCFHSQCDFKTSYKHSLQRHELKMHKNQCSVCHYKSRTRSLVQKHLRTEHGMYEQFQCMKCKFKTFQFMTLRRHNAKDHRKRSKSKFTMVRKTQNELTMEEAEEVKSLFKDIVLTVM